MRGFQEIRNELEVLGAQVVGVSADTWASLGAFAEQNGIEFPLLSDWPDNGTMRAFGARTEGSEVAARVTFVFDTGGIVRAVIDDPGDMEAHPEGALKAVRELAGGD